ncbi:MAG: endonuclease [Muribaculaceae bacterium]|nr:endonuclease [Muribaculaceae bacterium]
MKHSIRILLLPALLVLWGTAQISAEIPSGYYSSLNGKSEGTLKTAIHELLYNHTLVSSYSDLPRYFQRTDVHPDIVQNGHPMWWDMYAEIPLYTPSFSGLNREHSFPKSWWGGDTDTPAYTDLNHLYPSEMKANSAKSNYPLGVCSSTTFNNGVSKVGPPVTGQGGGAAKVFEPADEYKGDLARAYFYMVCCYQNLTWRYTYMVQQNLYPTLNSWSVNLLLQWHRQDPPSQKEYDRNEEVYKIQNNRNPFIDYPDLAEYLWGNKKGQMFYTTNSGTTPTGDPNLITPVQDMALDFGQVALGKSTTANLLFRGENLRRSLTVGLYKGDKQMFSLPTTSISTSLINTSAGYNLTITYTPTELGGHATSLLIYDGGLTGSRTITLHGECLPMPVLHTITALPATDIAEDSYTANWEVPADDVVDYYVVTRTRYNNGNSSTEELLAESNSLEITDFDASQSESYFVQSVRLEQRSEPSNIIFVEHGGITGIEADMTLGTAYIPGGIRFVCNTNHYNITVYDTMGRAIMTLPEVYPDMELQLPYGAYIITVEGQRQPLRVLVR